MIQIIPFERTNLEGMLSLVKEIQSEDPNDEEYDPEIKDVKRYEEYYLNEKEFHTILAVEENEVVGFISGFPRDSETFEIQMHYVSPKHRNNGIAKKLKTSMIAYARQNNYKQIHSDVLKSNEASIRVCNTFDCTKKDFGEYYKFIIIL